MGRVLPSCADNALTEEIGMTTGKKAASEAARELRSRKSTKPERRVAGSDLAQAKRKPPKKPKRP